MSRHHIQSLLLGVALLSLISCASSSQTSFRDASPPSEPSAPDILSVAQSHYEAGRQAVALERWDLAREELDRALALLWRADFQSIPREVTEHRRILRTEVEQVLSTILLHTSPTNVFFTEDDSTYEEEKGIPTAFEQLLRIESSDTFDEAVDGQLPDFSRFDLPIVMNPQVRSSIHLLRTDGSYRFVTWMNLVNRYDPLIRSVFQKEGLPGDLAYVAMIGSGHHPRAFSENGTAGLWQLSLKTAKDYGLQRTSWIDERLDPKKSTWIVANHFKALFSRLGDWQLVIAAHYAGLETVQNALSASRSSSIWDMSLPGETVRFVSMVMAAAIISKNPAAYGLELRRTLPVTYESVVIDQSLHLKTIAEGMNIAVDNLKLLNPELRKWRLPSGGYSLKIPVGTRSAFLTWAGIEPPGPDPSDIIVYTVRRGDNILKIARRFSVFADDIIVENDIRRPNRLKIGQVLFIPSYGQRRTSSTSSKTTTRSSRSNTPLKSYPVPDSRTHTRISYRVRRGDTLEWIGRRYSVPVGAIQSWNNLRNPRDLMAGQTLAIWVPSEMAAKPTPSRTLSGKKTIEYTVRRGDTLWDIARQFNITVSSIQAANNLTRRSRIFPGDKLHIVLPD